MREVLWWIAAAPGKAGLIDWVDGVCHVRAVGKRLGVAGLREVALIPRIRSEATLDIAT